MSELFKSSIPRTCPYFFLGIWKLVHLIWTSLYTITVGYTDHPWFRLRFVCNGMLNIYRKLCFKSRSAKRLKPTLTTLMLHIHGTVQPTIHTHWRYLLHCGRHVCSPNAQIGSHSLREKVPEATNIDLDDQDRSLHSGFERKNTNDRLLDRYYLMSPALGSRWSIAWAVDRTVRVKQ